MKTIVNKTRRPLRVPLPQGRTLHLGPNQNGQIAPHAADHPPLKRLLEAGEIEILEERGGETTRSGSPSPLQVSTHGHRQKTVRKGGDK